jgi:hypothetical protein
VHWLTVCSGAVLIALMANALNLFDLRPGRALKVYWGMSAVITGYFALVLFSDPIFFRWTHLTLSPFYCVMAFSLLLLATMVYAPFDFAGMMMLGDTGANPLGAFLGLCLALLLPFWGQTFVIGILILLHIYTERVSLTQTIARAPFLRWLDTLGRST